MPLNPATAQAEILKLTDVNNPDFVGWPSTPDQVAQNWAHVLEAYFGEMITPALPPGTLSAASSAMVGAMTPMIAPGAPGGPALTAGFLAFVLTFVPAAVPVIVVPPPAPYQPPALPPTADPIAPAVALATSIDVWARTGLWSTPPATPAPWA